MTNLKKISTNDPQILVHYYAQTSASPEWPGRYVTRFARIPIAQQEVGRLARLGPNEILDLPGELTEYLATNNSSFDQVALIDVKNNNKSAIRFYVNDVVRKGGEFDANQYRGQVSADDNWMTVNQAKTCRGIFAMSVIKLDTMGEGPGMKNVVLTATDKIVRLIDDTFRIIDPRIEFRQKLDPGAALHP